jgi:hypothetical protein
LSIEQPILANDFIVTVIYRDGSGDFDKFIVISTSDINIVRLTFFIQNNRIFMRVSGIVCDFV